MPLSERLTQPGREEHGNVYNRQEGNALRLLFTMLLDEMEQMGLRDRMNPVPRTAKDPKRFHTIHSSSFSGMCKPDWLKMNKAQRSQMLNLWLFNKFSLDRDGEVMVPPPGKFPKQAAISWNTVWLFPEERDTLMTRVITRYTEAEIEVLATAGGFDQ